MSFAVHVQLEYASRYALLGSMAREIADAFAARGCAVNPPTTPGAAANTPGMIVWLNFLVSADTLRPELTRPGSRAALVQFFVDHPFALWPDQMDALAAIPNFRLVLPCVDGAHLLRLRWPRLRHTHCLHGVSPRALCDAAAIEQSHRAAGDDARPHDLIVTGSIHTEAELDALRRAVPARVHRACDDVVKWLLAQPHTPFEHALDVALASDGLITGEWTLCAAAWRYVVAAVNRRRRIALVRAMQGVNTILYGGDAWKEFCTGTIRHMGETTYEELPRALAGARVCLALGPTQFTHTFSERLLLGMGAGCACVADDRLLVRKHFAHSIDGRAFAPTSRAADIAGAPSTTAPAAALFDASHPAAARAEVDRLLQDHDARTAMAAAARAEVERAHLWTHRLDTLAAVGSDALAA